MKAFHQYWTFSSIRGVLNTMAAVAVLAVPLAAGAMLTLPFLLALAVDCFAVYSLLDAGVTVLLAKLLPEQATQRRMLYVQAAMGMVTGMVMFLITVGVMSLHWAIWVAAAQAAVAAVCEWMVASDTGQEHGGLTCYASAAVLAMGALTLPLAAGLGAASVALALSVYLGLYGTSEVAVAGRMLFLEYRQGHPAAIASTAWRDAMEQARVARPGPVALPGSCEACPAGPLCRDTSVAAHWGQVASQRQPLLVRSVRLAAMRAAAQADCAQLRETA